MTAMKAKRRKCTLSERTTPCACCGYPISHRHHLMAVATHGENLHSARLCPNCHELFHLLQSVLIRRSRHSNRVLRQYTEVKGMDDIALRFMYSKVLEVEDIEGTFTRNAVKVTEAVREQLSLYVPTLTDMDILGTFHIVKESTGVQFKVGARVSAKADSEQISESLWVFYFRGTEVVKVETLQVKRGDDGAFVPLTPPPS